MVASDGAGMISGGLQLAPLAALMAIVLVGLVVEAVLGFGATVVVVALGAFLFPIDVLLPAYVPVNFLLSAYLVLRYRPAVDRRLLWRRVAPLMALGLPAGLALFRYAGSAFLQRAFGVFVVALAGLELLQLRRHRTRAGAISPTTAASSPAASLGRPLATGWATVLLVLGGVVHGAFGTGGPMAVYVVGREVVDKRVFRATLAALWLLLNTLLLASYAASGQLSLTSASTSLLLLPSLAGGLLAGEWAHARLRGQVFSALVFALLLLAGLALATRAK